MKRLLLLTAVLGMTMASMSPAMAQSGADGGFNCIDFPDQESAQLFLDSDPNDPEGLDADDDGLACEDELASSGVDTVDGTDSFVVTTARTGNNCPEPFVSNFDPNDPATAETFTCIAPGDTEAASPEVPVSEVSVSCDGFISAAGNFSQFSAQQFFDFNATPEEQAILDPDGNGFACDDGTLEFGVDPTAVATEEQYVVEEPISEVPSEVYSELPDTGGASLIALGAGALLVAGGLLVRRR